MPTPHPKPKYKYRQRTNTVHNPLFVRMMELMGVSQRELARMTGIQISTLNRWAHRVIPEEHALSVEEWTDGRITAAEVLESSRERRKQLAAEKAARVAAIAAQLGLQT